MAKDSSLIICRCEEVTREEILQAIVARDTELAVSRMNQHIRNAITRALGEEVE